MAANTALNVTGLNYDEIRANLRTFIAAKSTFADYDFSDSALGSLIDLLAYNTYYNAFYTNMAASEAFIDSAQFYDSVVSRAKLVGYTPISARGATANVRISFTTATANGTFTSLAIAKNTQFTATINGTSYTFVTPKSYTVVANSTNGFRENIELTEGYPLTHRFLFTTANTAFVLPNANVDTRSVTLTVTSSGNIQTYTLVDDILTVNSSSKIFYLEGERDFKYKIGFGDNVLGKRPDYNSTIAISYRVCNSVRGNGANNFSASGTVAGQTNFTLKVNSRATGGAEQEDIESVRFNAPKIYETQNRAVTVKDYQRIILRDNKDLQAVSVWGGEENDPPIYGKVYAAVKPYSGVLISTARKTQIKTNIRKYNVQAIDLEFVDPTFMYIIPSIKASFDTARSALTASQAATAVANRIITFEANNLNRFDGKFRYSRLLDYLDSADDGITGTTGSIKLQKRFEPSITAKNTYTFKFNQKILSPLLQTAITSTSFTFGGFTCYLDDDGSGSVRIYYYNGATKVLVNKTAGTVDYTTGKVVLTEFLPTAFSGSHLAVNVNPDSQNVNPTRNQLLLIADADVKVYDDTTNTQLAAVESISTVGETTTIKESALTTVTTY